MLTVQNYLYLCNQEILEFLQEKLPVIGGENWWQQTVIEKISESQIKIAEQKGFTKLADFDLAALLNIIEKNWREIAKNTGNLDYRDGRHLIIGLKNIRNHYAHESASGTEIAKKIQDVGTINSLLKLLNPASRHAIQGETLYLKLIAEMLKQSNLESKNPGIEPKSSPEQEGAASEISPTCEVHGQCQQETEDREGIPLSWLKANTILDTDILRDLSSATYVGIDFGTSTSVASIACVEDNQKGLSTKTIDVLQFDELGREIHSHLVDTCLAWFNQKLLFGIGAARLKQELVSNKTVWSSFKMGLGIDLGPEYYHTALPNGRFEYTIEKPQQATAVFLKLLCDGVRDYVSKKKLPKKIYYTVTVPASFEANQRQDLFAALKYAGIEESEIRLLDEPNSAFLSYLIDMESRSPQGERFADILQRKKLNVIVFDFGAGTCDISLLEVSTSNESILSRNLGISKFWALGGDDIDNVIAEQILLPQLCGGGHLSKFMFSTTQLEREILPHLKPIAEALKIRCCEIAEQKGYKTIADLRRERNKVTVKPGKPISINGKQWHLEEPQITLEEFSEVIALFVDQQSTIKSNNKIIDVLQPLDNALEKVELSKNDIDMVLFIGGSCENPIIRHYVSEHLGRFVESVIPKDLRAHVSQGAAMYTLLSRGAHVDPIKPIISETIYVLTAGGRLEPVVKAGTVVPSEGLLEAELEVSRENQKLIDLPFLSGSINKPLGIVQIKAPPPESSFKLGEKVKISWSYSKEKILQVTAETKSARQSAEFQNPLVNEEVTEEVIAMLKAKQAFNQSVLDGNSRPSVNATLTYSKAASIAGHWRLAAEMLEAVERLDPESDHATNICCYYSMDGDYKSSQKWSRTAYERNPSATTAFNYAIDKWRSNDIKNYAQLMEDSLAHDANFTATLEHYGQYLHEEGEVRGTEYLQRAYSILKKEMEEGILENNDISRLTRAAKKLGKKNTLADISNYSKKVKKIKSTSGFKEENLVLSSKNTFNNQD